jgi:DNA-binding transcriptional regulator YhcF (GntR family)
MSSPGDFVKINRSMLKWEWYHNVPTRVVFLHLLLSANWMPGKFQGYDVPPGDVVTSTKNLAVATGLSIQQVRTAISNMESTGEVTSRATSKFTIITLVNWAKYQTGQQADNKRSTNDQQTINNNIRREERKKERKERERVTAPRTLDVEHRRAAFAAECKAVTEAEPTRLTAVERKGFFAYWTETSKSGRMRFEAEKFFDHGRRMDTWQRRADQNPHFKASEKAIEETRSPGWQNRAPQPEPAP